jgi:uncharacterized membrane protein
MRSLDVLAVILIAVIVSLLSGVVLFGVLEIAPGVKSEQIAAAFLVMVGITTGSTLTFYFLSTKYASERALRVALMTLSEDERAVLHKIMELGGEVRQDDLWRKLRDRYSKSKLSALVINLERKRALTRQRYHRTNLLKLAPEFRRG